MITIHESTPIVPDVSITKNEAGKLLVMVNSSALAKSSCRLRFFNTVIVGLTTPVYANDIEWGSAFHLFRQIFREKGYEAAYKEGIKAAKKYYEDTPMRIKGNKQYLTTEYLITACISYAEKYKKDTFETVCVDGIPLVEQKFAIPYYIDDVMELVLCGTVDEIGKFRNGIYSICDLKTSAMWNHEEYFESYRLSPQMLFYRWQLSLYAKSFPDSIYARIEEEDCGVFIDGVFHNGKGLIDLKRGSVMLFKAEQLVRFAQLVDNKVKQIVEDVHYWQATGEYPLEEGMLNGACSTKFGLCEFAAICKATDKETKEHVTSANFVKKPYQPLHLHQ